MNAPVHSEIMRHPRRWAWRKASSTSAGTRSGNCVDGTTTVSAACSASRPHGTCIRNPGSTVTEGAAPQMDMRYQGTPNASA